MTCLCIVVGHQGEGSVPTLPPSMADSLEGMLARSANSIPSGADTMAQRPGMSRPRPFSGPGTDEAAVTLGYFNGIDDFVDKTLGAGEQGECCSAGNFAPPSKGGTPAIFFRGLQYSLGDLFRVVFSRGFSDAKLRKR